MSMQDPIADMLTRIRNAQAVNKESVLMPFSKLKFSVAEVLKQEGYIIDCLNDKEAEKPTLKVVLKYHNGKGVIEHIDRTSKPALRIYKGRNELPLVKGGLGVAIVSTSKGLMTAAEAAKQGLGGEIICTVS